MQGQRRRVKVSKELRAAIEIQNKANVAAKVESRKPRYVLRAEANEIRRELKRDSMLTTAKRSRVEHFRQVTLAAQRKAHETKKLVDELLKGLPSKERKTETGIVLPSGRQVSKLAMPRVRE